MKRVEKILGLLKESAQRMADDQTLMMGAALAYYMMFSIAPLLIIAVGAAGVVFGRGAGGGVLDGLQDQLGPEAAQALRSMVAAAASRPHAGRVATVVGVITLAAGASGVFSQLQQSLNVIWRVAAKPGSTWRVLVRQRLFSFGMIAVFGLLMLISVAVSAALSAVGSGFIGSPLAGAALWSAVNTTVSLLIMSGMFSAVLKFLPDVRLSWRDVRVGGTVTALLFVAGKAAIGAYIGRSGVSSAYGAAGSLIVILLWVFYSSQILFFGAEFTRAWAQREGRRVEPREGAVLAAPAAAAEHVGSVDAADRHWLRVTGFALAASAWLLSRRSRPADHAPGMSAAFAALGLLVLIRTGAAPTVAQAEDP
jgi:membrane protein